MKHYCIIFHLSLSRYEGCEYECQICQTMFFYRRYLRLHLQKEHHMSTDDYTKKFGQLESKMATLRCHICSKDLKWNIDSISHHIQNRHGIDKSTYKRRFITETDQVGSEEIADLPDSSKGEPKLDMEKRNNALEKPKEFCQPEPLTNSVGRTLRKHTTPDGKYIRQNKQW